MADLSNITGKLAKAVRLLSSDRDGEVLAAVASLQRILKNAGADLHALADHIERSNGGKISEADMRRLYDAGYNEGVRVTELNMHGEDDFRSIDGLPSPHGMALWCQRRNAKLSANESDFIDDMAGRLLWSEPTERQMKWLKSIFFRLGGKT
jgi:hypothetical protein